MEVKLSLNKGLSKEIVNMSRVISLSSWINSQTEVLQSDKPFFLDKFTNRSFAAKFFFGLVTKFNIGEWIIMEISSEHTERP